MIELSLLFLRVTISKTKERTLKHVLPVGELRAAQAKVPSCLACPMLAVLSVLSAGPSV